MLETSSVGADVVRAEVVDACVVVVAVGLMTVWADDGMSTSVSMIVDELVSLLRKDSLMDES